MKSQKMLRAAGGFAVLHFALESVSAQNCYYPNGDVSRTDASCSDDGGACCPLDWICLSNGLCWLDDSNDYYGRYTCTDRSWGGDCPQYCTSNNTAAGNEAIVQCADGSWCCDKNRDPTKVDCCDWDDKETIDVGNPIPVTRIESTPTAPSSDAPPSTTNKAATSASASASTTSPSHSSSSSSITPTSSTSESTITTTATSSDSAGGIVIITSILTTQIPISTGNADPSTAAHHAPSNNGIVIGLSVAIPVALLALLLTIFILWRRRKQKQYAQRQPPTSDYPRHDMISDMYSHSKTANEIDSYPVADVSGGGGGKDQSRPISELTGSSHFFMTPNSPVSTITKNSNSSNGIISPPGYSPSVAYGGPGDGGGTTRGGGGGGGGCWTTSPLLPGVAEQPEPQELPAEGNPSSAAKRSGLAQPSPLPALPQHHHQQASQPMMPEVHHEMVGGSNNTTFQSGPYSQFYQPYRLPTEAPPEVANAAEAVPPASAHQQQIRADHTSSAMGHKEEDGSSSGRMFDEERGRFSPDPPQPATQGGLRVVNQ